MSTQAIQIFDNEGGQLVPADFHDEMRPDQFVNAEATWGPERSAAVQRLLNARVPSHLIPQHWHWNWSRKAQRLNLLAYRGFGIECGGQWQGLMLTTLAGHAARLPPDDNRPLIYVDFLEVAPWNVTPFAATPKYKGVGIQLFEAAVRQSIVEGFKGRVGLHALRDAESFYQHRGMTNLGPDAQHQDLPYFELTATGATSFLSRRGT
jgi:hypothetical protein